MRLKIGEVEKLGVEIKYPLLSPSLLLPRLMSQFSVKDGRSKKERSPILRLGLTLGKTTAKQKEVKYLRDLCQADK